MGEWMGGVINFSELKEQITSNIEMLEKLKNNERSVKSANAKLDQFFTSIHTKNILLVKDDSTDINALFEELNRTGFIIARKLGREYKSYKVQVSKKKKNGKILSAETKTIARGGIEGINIRKTNMSDTYRSDRYASGIQYQYNAVPATINEIRQKAEALYSLIEREGVRDLRYKKVYEALFTYADDFDDKGRSVHYTTRQMPMTSVATALAQIACQKGNEELQMAMASDPSIAEIGKDSGGLGSYPSVAAILAYSGTQRVQLFLADLPMGFRANEVWLNLTAQFVDFKGHEHITLSGILADSKYESVQNALLSNFMENNFSSFYRAGVYRPDKLTLDMPGGWKDFYIYDAFRALVRSEYPSVRYTLLKGLEVYVQRNYANYLIWGDSTKEWLAGAGDLLAEMARLRLGQAFKGSKKYEEAFGLQELIKHLHDQVRFLYAKGMQMAREGKTGMPSLEDFQRFLNGAGTRREPSTTMSLEDAYEFIGVKPTATDDEVKMAYRKLAQKYHPDAHVGENEKQIETSVENFKKLANAYAVVLDARMAMEQSQPPVSRREEGEATA